MIANGPVTLNKDRKEGRTANHNVVLGALCVYRGLNVSVGTTAMAVRNVNGINDMATGLLGGRKTGVMTIDSISNNVCGKGKLGVPTVLRCLSIGNGLLSNCGRSNVGEVSGRRLLALSAAVLVPTTLRGRVGGSGTSGVGTGIVIRNTGNPAAVRTSRVLSGGNIMLIPSVLTGSNKIVISCFR